MLDQYQVRTINDPRIAGSGEYNDFVEKAEEEEADVTGLGSGGST